MQKSLLTLLTTIICITSYAQVNFEVGYLITDSNQKINCLIKNKDWSNNPTKFEYKLSENSVTETADISLTKEFAIIDKFNYKRFNLKIDRSSNQIADLTDTKEPSFKKEQLFLKLLVKGKASLYLYKESSFRRYFYEVENSSIQQLVFKKYKEKGRVSKNNKYKQQLWSTLKCSDITFKNVNRITYTKSDLTSFFIKYNQCDNPNYKIAKTKSNKGEFHIAIKPGVKSSSLKIKNELSPRLNTDLGKKTGFRLGVELEYILPFNNKKWAIFTEPTYQSFKSENTTQGRITANSNATGIQQVSIDYKSIELPIGVRYYMFLNNNSKIFLNTALVNDIPISSKIEYKVNGELELNSSINILLGLGYKYKNKYSIEFRYSTGRDLLQKYPYSNAKYNSTSVIIGVNIF